jgi:hypothetical protein
LGREGFGSDGADTARSCAALASGVKAVAVATERIVDIEGLDAKNSAALARTRIGLASRVKGTAGDTAKPVDSR